MFSRPRSLLRATLPVLLLSLVSASALLAQAGGTLPGDGGLAQQSLKPYWHVFIAYAIAVVLILGWVVSIARRLSSLERRLED